MTSSNNRNGFHVYVRWQNCHLNTAVDAFVHIFYIENIKHTKLIMKMLYRRTSLENEKNTKAASFQTLPYFPG